MRSWLAWTFSSAKERGDFVPPCTYLHFHTDFILSTNLCFKIYSIKHWMLLSPGDNTITFCGGGGCFFSWVFFFWVYRPTREIFTLMETSPLQILTCSPLMVIEQWGFLSVPHRLWHRASVYYGHLRGPVTLSPIVERLAVELSLPVFTTKVCRDRGLNPNFPHTRRTLYHYATAAVNTIITVSCICCWTTMSAASFCINCRGRQFLWGRQYMSLQSHNAFEMLSITVVCKTCPLWICSI